MSLYPAGFMVEMYYAGKRFGRTRKGKVVISLLCLPFLALALVILLKNEYPSSLISIPFFLFLLFILWKMVIFNR